MTFSIYDFNLTDLENELIILGEKKYRAKQIFSWLYEKRVRSFEEMSDLPKDLISKLNERYHFNDLELVTKQISKDGTTKFLYRLKDGHLIETVLMFFDYGTSVCITSQVGCNMACKFCASGLLKKKRNLSVGEMVNQILSTQIYLDSDKIRLANLVVMGIGEPFDNFDNLIKALGIINHPKSLAIGARHMTISTCGVVPKIYDFANLALQYNLAISLHAPNDTLRSEIMPINKLYNIDKLFEALDYYSRKSNRRITLEYLLLKDVNDGDKEAYELINLVKNKNAYVNLIPYNEVKENIYKSTDEKRALAFYDILKKAGIGVTLRAKKGDDIDAACGQLRANNERKD